LQPTFLRALLKIVLKSCIMGFVKIKIKEAQ